jgi:hypothetical protein
LFAGFVLPLLDLVNDNLKGPCFSLGGDLGNGGLSAFVGLCLESLTDFEVDIVRGTAGLFCELPVAPLCLPPGSFFISLPLGLLDLRPLLRRRIFLLEGDLLSSPLDDLDEPIELERVVVLRLRALGCFCGDCVGRAPKGIRFAFPPDRAPPGLFVSSGSFFMVLVNPEGEGPKLIPAAIAPNRFCSGACDLDPIRLSAAPRAPFSDLIRTEDGSAREFGLFERFLSFLISVTPCLLAIYSGEEDLLFRL